MNERIALIRKKAQLNQQAFAERIGLTKNFVSLLETGNRAPSDRTLSDICREFNINEAWLRTGEGEMYKAVNRDAEIAAFMGDIMREEDADFRRRLIAVLARLEVEEWELLERIALKLAQEAKKKTRPKPDLLPLIYESVSE